MAKAATVWCFALSAVVAFGADSLVSTDAPRMEVSFYSAMRRRTPLLFAVAVIAGLFWSLGSNLDAVATHLIGPLLFGVTVAAFWRAAVWRRQLLLVVGFLVVAEAVRLVLYCWRASGWHYITGDSETQLWLAGSFALQVLVGVVAWGAARLFIRWHETRTA